MGFGLSSFVTFQQKSFNCLGCVLLLPCEQSVGAVPAQVLPVVCHRPPSAAGKHGRRGGGQTAGLRGGVRPTQQQQTLHNR